ncbi:MAG: hypothetical protein ACRC62_37020 [Microcoleus sp.]
MLKWKKFAWDSPQSAICPEILIRTSGGIRTVVYIGTNYDTQEPMCSDKNGLDVPVDLSAEWMLLSDFEAMIED